MQRALPTCLFIGPSGISTALFTLPSPLNTRREPEKLAGEGKFEFIHTDVTEKGVSGKYFYLIILNFQCSGKV